MLIDRHGILKGSMLLRLTNNPNKKKEAMTQHIVKLVFIYDEESFPEVTDEESAKERAIQELEEINPHAFEFDYQKSD